ncbi:hypothetical protein HDR62_00065, partial [bacterium]|nr:hypothetical protein [bacterium]
MRRLWRFSFFERFFALWAGIVFCGVCSVRAQERPLDTVPLFNAHADTVRVEFEDILHISATDEDAFRYAYRWNINGKEAGEDNALDLFPEASGENALVFFSEASGENALDFSFSGQRKNKITGRRVAPSGHSYHFDITNTRIDEYFFCAQETTDTVYLEAFSEYTNDNASWLWMVNGDTLSSTGPQIRLTATKEDWLNYNTRVDCYFQTGNEGEDRHVFAYIFWSHPTGRSIYLPENKDGHFYHLYVFNQEFDRIYAHPNDTLCLDVWAPGEFPLNSSLKVTWWYSSFLMREEYFLGSDSSLIVFFRGTQDRDFLYVIKDIVQAAKKFFIHWGLAEIETDSVWVFFPQYPYSNLGGVVDICWPPDAPLPSADDTV